MLDDAHLVRQRVLAARQTALRAFAGVGERVNVALIGQHGGAEGNADTGFVHHLEHVRQALVGLADQIADRTVLLTEAQYGGGGVAVTHLMQQTGQCDVISRAQAAVLVDQHLGYQEQRDALDASRCAFDTSQHHVYDIVGQLVVAAGDEHLLAEHAVAAICCRARGGADVAEGRALTRLGQGHGSAVAAVQHRRQEALAQRIAGEALDQVGGADGQEGIAGSRNVGGAEVRNAAAQDDFRQLQATVFGVVVRGVEAGFGQSIPGGFGFRNQGDLFAVEGRLVGIAFLVVRSKKFGSDAAGGFQRGVEDGAVVLGVARALQQRLGVEHFVELEIQLAFVQQFVGHDGLVGRVDHRQTL